MKVPFLDLMAQLRTVESGVRAGIDRVLASGEFILGSESAALEAEMAAFSGVSHAIAVSNGSDAILATLMTLGIGPGDEVIVPTFTFFATAGAVARVGARPVFVDILPETFNIDPEAVEAAITSRTKAIIPVHLYGQCADMPELMNVARRHHLAVIEDAAQAVGATYAGKHPGGYGNAATLSFYPTKNLSTIGEGGMVLTNDAALDRKLRQIRSHGQTEQYFHHFLGGNFRLDGLKSAALRAKLPVLPKWTACRQAHAARYDRGLRGSTVIPPPVLDACSHVYHQYTIRSPQRDALRAHLTAAGIATGVYYPLPLHLQPCFEYCGGKRGQLPVAERAAAEVLSLPIFPELTTEQVDYVIETIRKFG